MHSTKYFLSTTAILFLIFIAFTIKLHAQDSTGAESEIMLHTSTGNIAGTLILPATQRKLPVALIIAGSGPTDRNGNSIYTQNNAYKLLADSLAKYSIASLRYDKRGIGASMNGAKAEDSLVFDDYVNDAKDWINLLKQDRRFFKK